jgi:hypothetical protein
MAVGDTTKVLRGALRNAVVWGIGWFTVALAVVGVVLALGLVPGASWIGGLGLAARFGIWGVIAGGVFSTFIRLWYRGRRLSDINWVRFGLAGGVLTGIAVPLLLQTLNLLSGDGLVPWNLVLDDGIWTAVLGGAAAGGSLKLAQHAERALGRGKRDRLDAPDGSPRLGRP